MLLRALALSFALCLAGTAAAAQSVQILTIEPDRLFADSAAGQTLSKEFEAQSSALAEENRRIEAELVAEEADLTARRPTLAPDEFRTLADAFDTKVQDLRAQQDNKARALIRTRDEARQKFLAESLPVLAEILSERGAIVLLDKANVFLSADAIDITDEAIRRLDARQPAEPPTPAPEDGAAPAEGQE